jgi:hypothetical protein
MPSVADAEDLARELLEPLANRWVHVQAVAARAAGLTPAVTGEDDRQLLGVLGHERSSTTLDLYTRRTDDPSRVLRALEDYGDK